MKNYLILFSLLIVLFSCKKEKADTANATYSSWTKPETYTKDTIFGIWGFYYDIPAPQITQSVLDTGAVLVYAKLNGYNTRVWPTGQVGLLPIQIVYQQSGVQVDTWSAAASVGKIRIRFINDHNIYTSINNSHEFRYIIIPGSIRANVGVVMGNSTVSNAQLAEDYAHLSYEEVCRKYHVPL
jgi:hypothetical protein